MNLDGRLLNPILGEEVGNLGALVSLKLDDLTHLLIVDKSSVARKFLLRFQYQLCLITQKRKKIKRYIEKFTFLKALRIFLESYSRGRENG